MQRNIILSGVGGQGILTIAAIIDLAALSENLFIKQAEVHGMSQRGGAVQSHLRISSEKIYSDLIAKGSADLILSVEPMESLRYLDYLSDAGTVITSTTPYINIPDYPDKESLLAELRNIKKVKLVDADKLAKEAGSLKASNIVMLGAACEHLGITQDVVQKSIEKFFATKGPDVIKTNLKAFILGTTA